MPHRRLNVQWLFAAATVLVAGFETWSVFVGETAAVTIQGYHRKTADEFGSGTRISQAFRMTGGGLSAVDVQFSTDRPLDLMIRCELAENDEPGSLNGRVISSQVATLKHVSGMEWRRISFPPVEESDQRWYVLRLDLIGAVSRDDYPRRPGDASSQPRVAVIVSRENVYGGGALWIADRRQLGSLFLRGFSHRRTAYERFRADLAPSLPRPLNNAILDVGIAIVYQAAMVAVIYALLIGESKGRRAA
jgi:hypothetical protein